MSENPHVGAGDGRRTVLAVVRAFAEIMLTRADADQDDEDIANALIAALRILVPAAEVLRARFVMNGDGELHLRESHDVARLRASGETEETLFAAVSSTHPVSRHGLDGEVTSLMEPLVLRGGVIDLYVLQTTADGGVTEVDALAFSTLCDLASAAIMVREAHDEARLDALTGCLNHGAMHAQLVKEVARADRADGRLACVMLDLDDFKAVNERHGHPVGDQLLRAVATNLAAECRSYDSCCRYGGDEFLVILPNSDMEVALGAAARIRAAVRRAVVRHGGDEIAVTSTTGVAVWKRGESTAELIARADQALFRGKAAKRDEEPDS